MKRLLVCFLCLCLVLLGGCGADAPPERTDGTISAQNLMQSHEPLITGSLLSEPLEVTSWDSGRAGMTSGYYILEVEDGFYFNCAGKLLYADKADLSSWIPVCSEPDCPHELHSGDCDACIDGQLLLKDGRIYTNISGNGAAAVEYAGVNSGALISMAMDGSDKRLEYVFSDIEARTHNGTYVASTYLCPEYFVCCFERLREDGRYDQEVRMADENGEAVIFTGITEEDMLESYCANWSALHGDFCFMEPAIEGSYTTAYRIVNRELIPAQLAGLPGESICLAGNIARIFRPNDGYYDVNLTTGEETKLADPKMENSSASLIMPNCILESGLLGFNSLELRQDIDRHAMWMFDGETWTEVQLPADLVRAADTFILAPKAVGADRILIIGWDTEIGIYEDDIRVYQIYIDTDSPTLEYLGTLG